MLDELARGRQGADMSTIAAPLRVDTVSDLITLRALDDVIGPVAAASRLPLSHPGFSGSRIEALDVVLASGERRALVLKHVKVADDWTLRLGGDRWREGALLAEASLAGVWSVFACPYLAYAGDGEPACSSRTCAPPSCRTCATRLRIAGRGADRRPARLHARFWEAPALELPWLNSPALYADLLAPHWLDRPDILAIMPPGIARRHARLDRGVPPPLPARRHTHAPPRRRARPRLGRPAAHPLPRGRQGGQPGAPARRPRDRHRLGFDGRRNRRRGPRLVPRRERYTPGTLQGDGGGPLPVAPRGGARHAGLEVVWDHTMRVAVVLGARLLLWSKARNLETGSAQARAEWAWWAERLDEAGSALTTNDGAMKPGGRSPQAPMMPETLQRLTQAVYPSFAMLAGMQLDVFTPLAGGARSAAELAAEVGGDAERLELLLYALVAAELLRVEDGRFSNSPEAQRFLVRGTPYYAGARHELLSDTWSAAMRTAESIRAGQPRARHDFMTMTGEELGAFFRGLHPDALAHGRDLAARFDFSAQRTLLDVGGGSGGVSLAVTEAWPHLRALVVDLPGVAAIARQFVAEAGAEERVQVMDGNAVEGPIPGAWDVAVLRAFLQVLPPAQARRALRTVAAALAPRGHIIIIGRVLDDSRTTPMESVMMNLASSTSTRAGARSRRRSTERGWRRLASRVWSARCGAMASAS